MRRLAVTLVAAVSLLGGCTGDVREDGERQLGVVTVPPGWNASTVDYKAAGTERRYDEWTVGYANLADDEASVRASYADALVVAGWAPCATGAVHNDLIKGDYCKNTYEIVLTTRRSSVCVPATMTACTELTVMLYKVA